MNQKKMPSNSFQNHPVSTQNCARSVLQSVRWAHTLQERLVRQNRQTGFLNVSALRGYCNQRQCPVSSMSRVVSGCTASVWCVSVFTQAMDTNRYHSEWLFSKRKLGLEAQSRGHARKIVHACSRVLECAQAGHVPLWTVYCSQLWSSMLIVVVVVIVVVVIVAVVATVVAAVVDLCGRCMSPVATKLRSV